MAEAFLLKADLKCLKGLGSPGQSSWMSKVIPRSPPLLGSAAATAKLSPVPCHTLSFPSEPPLLVLLPLPRQLSQNPSVPPRPRWDHPSSGWNLTHPWSLELELSCCSWLLFSFWHFPYSGLSFSTCQPCLPGTNSSRAGTCLIRLCEEFCGH